jgi:nucleotide-binding universal stress UspA family protein
MKNLLVASDLTALSDRAVQRAARLAAQFDASLTVLHVINEALHVDVRRQLGAEAAKVMSNQLTMTTATQEVKGEIRVAAGEAFAEIIRTARAVEADLTILGMHRKQGLKELFVGTTVERVLRYSERPVLVVKDQAMRDYERVLIPVDFSVPSRRALAEACRIAPGAEYHVVHGYDVPFAGFITDEAARREAEADHQTRLEALIREEMDALLSAGARDSRRIKRSVRRGAVLEVIHDQIGAVRPDLLVMGTHGRTGVARAMVGSVAQEILVDPPCDVLAVGAW